MISYIVVFLMVLFQVSLFPHVFPAGLIVNFAALFVIIARKYGLALWGGLLLDIYSDQFFGFWTAMLLIGVFLVESVLRYYVQKPIFKKAS
jgi:hypothetical protein